MKTLTTQPTSLMARARRRQTSQIPEVCELLNWSHQQYCDHQYEQYELFITRKCEGYPKICRQLRYSPIFSGFWTNAWAQRNQVDFLPFAGDKLSKTYVSAEGVLGINADYEVDPDMVDGYLYINNYMRLINDDEFMIQYDHALKLVRNAEINGKR